MKNKLQLAAAVLSVCVLTGVMAARADDRTPPAAPDSTEIPKSQWSQVPLKWAKVLFTQEIRLPGGVSSRALQGFFIKAPTGQILAVSPYATIGGFNAADPKSKIESWSMFPLGTTEHGIAIGPELLPSTTCQTTGAMLMKASATEAANAEVLTPAAAGPQEGQSVLFVTTAPPTGGGEADRPGALRVFGATIVGLNRHFEGAIGFGFFGKVSLPDMHGGLLLDADGHVLAVQTSYYPESTSGNKVVGAAVSIEQLLKEAKLPSEPAAGTPAPLTSGPSAGDAATHPSDAPAAVTLPAAPPAAPPSADPAQKALRLARMYEASEQYGPARDRLQSIIDTYPNTPAAAAAQADLQKIQGK